MGGPLGKTKVVNKSGIRDIRNEMGAFTIVMAASHEEAAKMFENHPHFMIFPGDRVEVLEREWGVLNSTLKCNNIDNTKPVGIYWMCLSNQYVQQVCVTHSIRAIPTSHKRSERSSRSSIETERRSVRSPQRLSGIIHRSLGNCVGIVESVGTPRDRRIDDISAAVLRQNVRLA
jgi:hypothetical protein